MYADKISTGRKRSVHERLDGDLPAASGAGGGARHNVSKRSVQTPAPPILLPSCARCPRSHKLRSEPLQIRICSALGFSVRGVCAMRWLPVSGS
jgi:hypothetical protein